MARCCYFFNHKFLLNCCNFLFLLCGLILAVSGFYLFTDSRRILLSRLLAAASDQLNDLPQPLFYYISIGLAITGLIAILATIVGCWATCLHTYCFLSLYFLLVVILLLAESVVCLAITLWPHCLGISLDEVKMVKVLQANYGVPGKEQFTIAMDLAQTRFGCCGMNSELNYDTSMWKLQAYGQRDWVVPLSCCLLENVQDRMAYLDPKPTNESLCESVQRLENEHYRHSDPCLTHLDNWYREQYVIFLGASLIIAIVEFCVLLSIILNCTKIAKKRFEMNSQRGEGSLLELRQSRRHPETKSSNAEKRFKRVENIYKRELDYHRNGSGGGGCGVNGSLGLRLANPLGTGDSIEDFKEVYVQPRDLHKQRHQTTFKPRANEYQLPTRGYLV